MSKDGNCGRAGVSHGEAEGVTEGARTPFLGLRVSSVAGAPGQAGGAGTAGCHCL